MSLQLFLEINDDPDPRVAEQREEDVTALARAILGDVHGVAIDGIAVRSQANLDPAAVANVAVLLTSVSGAVGAGTALLFALRKMVTEGGALIRAIKVEINGEPRLLENATLAEIDKEISAR